MSFPAGYNFRGTSAYVIDPPNHTYSIVATPNYPFIGPLGNTVGWEQAIDASVNRTTGFDARLAGVAFIENNKTPANFRVDLPSAGDYGIRIASGDSTFGSSNKVELFDNNTSLGVLVDKIVATTNKAVDASNVERTYANWPSDNVEVIKTFASTILRLRIGGHAGGAGTYTKLVHLNIRQVDAPAFTRQWRIPTNAADATAVRVVIMDAAGTAVEDFGETTASAGYFTFDCTDQDTPNATRRLAFVHNWDDNLGTVSMSGGPCIAEVIEFLP